MKYLTKIGKRHPLNSVVQTKKNEGNGEKKKRERERERSDGYECKRKAGDKNTYRKSPEKKHRLGHLFRLISRLISMSGFSQISQIVSEPETAQVELSTLWIYRL